MQLPAWLIIGVFHPSLFFAATPSPGEDEKDGPKVVFFHMPFGAERPALPAALFGLDAFRCVGHFHQPLLGDELAGGLADAVGLVLDADECHFEILYELHLMRCQTRTLLLGKRRRSLFEYLERRRCILCIVVSGMRDCGAQRFVVVAGGFEFFENLRLELREFFVAVT